MNKITLTEKSKVAASLLERIHELHNPEETVRFMEVCGTHTVAIFREGIRQMLPKGIELISGPGCPVCVTDQQYMDQALAYAAREDVVIATFGDMLKIPGTTGNLWQSKENGAHIEIIYSPMEVLGLSERYADKKIIFLGIGFETTIAVIAATIQAVHAKGLKNVFFLISHKLVPPALRALLSNPDHQIDGFLLPGHVSVIIGEQPYQFLADEYHMPSCIAGFDGVEILAAIVNLLEQRKEQKFYVGNTYRSVVAKTGNPVAQQLMHTLYEPSDDGWRGIGTLPASGLKLRGEWSVYDALVQLPLETFTTSDGPKGCQCGSVIQGMIHPDACPLFGKLCTPEHPVGACMVSVEGSCSAWYKYGFSSGGMTWEE